MTLFISACGGSDSVDVAETTSSYQLLTVRRDERCCAATTCDPGWAL